MNARQRSPKFFARCVTICGFVGLVVSNLHADEGHVATLYQHFLTGSNSAGFVAFEREIIFPLIRQIGMAAATGGSNRVQQLEHTNKNYFSFCWQGSNFVIATSRDGPMTNETGVAAARRLHGYDGQSYWRFLNEVSHTYLNSKEEVGFRMPVDSTSMLTVIPKDEALNSRTNYIPNSTLSTINELAAECRRVVQLGFSYPMLGQPVVIGSNALVVSGVGGRKQTARIAGGIDHPQVLEYDPSGDKMPRYRVSIEYPREILTIDRLSASGTRPVTTIRYKILSIQLPRLSREESMFSWETYKATSRSVITEVATNGATVTAKFKNDGGLDLGHVVAPAKPLLGRGRKTLYIYLAFVVVIFGLPAVIFLHYR